MSNKGSKNQKFAVVMSVVAAVLAVFALVFVLLLMSTIQAEEPETKGMVYFDSITVEDDIAVTDDLSVTDDLAVTGLINHSYNEENIGLPSVMTTAITYTASGAIFTVADGELWLVHGMWVNVTTNFDCTGDDCTLTIGDGNDADGFIVLADAQMQAADVGGPTGSAAGWQGIEAATRGVYLDEVTTNAYVGGFVYAPSGAAETIDVTIGGTSPAGGAATIYVLYTRLE